MSDTSDPILSTEEIYKCLTSDAVYRDNIKALCMEGLKHKNNHTYWDAWFRGAAEPQLTEASSGKVYRKIPGVICSTNSEGKYMIFGSEGLDAPEAEQLLRDHVAQAIDKIQQLQENPEYQRLYKLLRKCFTSDDHELCKLALQLNVL